MEKRIHTMAILTSLILLFTGFATASTIINYQGLLTDTTGEPVPDSTYQIIFSIWDAPTLGNQLWIEPHPAVQTTNGHFSVELGSIDPISLDDLGSAALYLQMQVEIEPPMDPRIQLNWVPYGAISQRVLGDVATDEGSLTIQLPESEQTPYINLSVDSAQANVMLAPGYADGPSANLALTETIDGDDASLLLRGGDAGGDGAPALNFEADENAASVMMGVTNGPSANMTVTLTTEAYDAGVSFYGAEGGPSLKAGADPDAAGIIIVNNNPVDEEKSINIGTSADEAGIIIINTQPADEEKSINIGTSADEAGIIIVNTRPTGEVGSINLAADPSETGIVIVNTMPSGDSSIVELGANNAADITVNFTEPLDNQAHGVQVFSDSAGANINMYQQAGDGEELGTPMFSINGAPNSGVFAKIFNPQPEPPGGNPMIEMSSALGNNASFKVFQPQSEAPGDLYEAIVLSNMANGSSRAPGASVKMFQPQPEPPGLPAAIQMAAQTDNTLFDVFKFSQDATGIMDSVGMHVAADSAEVSMEFLRGGNTWVKIFANDNTGGAKFFTDPGSEYMGFEPSPFYNAGDIKMYDSTQATSIIVSSLGQVSIGTDLQTNILTIARGSSTDPIADAWTTYSSRRWKRNIEPIDRSLDKVMSLRGVSFEWKENGKEDIGLIAEEVAEVVPEVVAFEENGEDAKSVDYSRLVALLIEATKEQQKEIEELKTEIIELRGKIR